MNIKGLNKKWTTVALLVLAGTGLSPLASDSSEEVSTSPNKAPISVKKELDSGRDKNLVLQHDPQGTYKTDPEYRALQRYHWPDSPKKKSAEKKGKKIRDTMRRIDKPLTLAGRGFEIQGFAALSYIKREFDFDNRLRRSYPDFIRDPPQEKLDVTRENARIVKNFIFHPTRTGMNRLRAVAMQEPQEFPVRPVIVLESLPETYLRLRRRDESQLILHRADHALDLLMGNQKSNRAVYESW